MEAVARATTFVSDDSPVLAIRYSNGVLGFTQDFWGQRTILYRKRSDLRNRWLDFRFGVRLSSRTTGCGFKGVTANSENSATGYPSPSYFYFKMGLYRDVMAKPMTIYIDEYRKRQLRGDDL